MKKNIHIAIIICSICFSVYILGLSSFSFAKSSDKINQNCGLQYKEYMRKKRIYEKCESEVKICVQGARKEAAKIHKPIRKYGPYTQKLIDEGVTPKERKADWDQYKKDLKIFSAKIQEIYSKCHAIDCGGKEEEMLDAEDVYKECYDEKEDSENGSSCDEGDERNGSFCCSGSPYIKKEKSCTIRYKKCYDPIDGAKIDDEVISRECLNDKDNTDNNVDETKNKMSEEEIKELQKFADSCQEGTFKCNEAKKRLGKIQKDKENKQNAETPSEKQNTNKDNNKGDNKITEQQKKTDEICKTKSKEECEKAKKEQQKQGNNGDKGNTKQKNCGKDCPNKDKKEACLGKDDKLYGNVDYYTQKYKVGRGGKGEPICMRNEVNRSACYYVGKTLESKINIPKFKFSKNDFCCGIKLNTDVPFVGRCISTDKEAIAADDAPSPDTAFVTLMKALISIVMVLIMVGAMIMLIISGVMIASGNYADGKALIIRVVISLVLLGASGIILRLINPIAF